MKKEKPSVRVVSNADFQEAWSSIDNQRVMWKIGRGYSHTLNDEDLRECFMKALLYVLQRHDYEKQKFTTSLTRFTQHRCNDKLKSRQLELCRESLDHEACNLIPVWSEQEEPCEMSLGDSILYDWYVVKLRMGDIAEKHDLTRKEVRRFLKCGAERVRPQMELSL